MAQSRHLAERIPTQITVKPNQQSNNTKDALSVTSKEQIDFQFERNLLSGMSNVEKMTPDAYNNQSRAFFTGERCIMSQQQ